MFHLELTPNSLKIIDKMKVKPWLDGLQQINYILYRLCLCASSRRQPQ